MCADKKNANTDGENIYNTSDLPRKYLELQSKLAELNQEIKRRDSIVKSLKAIIVEREKNLQRLAVETIQLQFRFNKDRSSFAWKILRPVRGGRNFIRRLRKQHPVELVALNQLDTAAGNWRATGSDPQFLLLPEKSWRYLSGWYWLDLEVSSDRPLHAELFYDTGDGFNPAQSLSFQLAPKGHQRIPFFVPPRCRAIRLDPCNGPLSFSLNHLILRVLPGIPELSPPFSEQLATFDLLKGPDSNVATFRPVNDLGYTDQSGYVWEATGTDPFFILDGIDKKLSAGWCSVDLCIDANKNEGTCKLYFDYGGGFKEIDALVLPFSNDKQIERVFYLKGKPKCVRLDPLECQGLFTIKQLNIVSLQEKTAYDKMLNRIVVCVANLKNETIDDIYNNFKTQSALLGIETWRLLYQSYNDTFPVVHRLRSSVCYEDWIAKTEEPEYSALSEEGIVFPSYRPTISVVMPVYNTPEPFLRKAIESVLAQTYPDWELCIADDCSTEPHVRFILNEYAQTDPRIKLIFREKNGHISAASNSALTLATCEYVALLDHDDELAIHALYFVAEALNRFPGAKILYSDEDKIDDEGTRFDPHFKSDWNPDLFLSQNYVSHLGVYQRELLSLIGGFREGVEGSQDHDLLLRCLHYVKSDEIVHIPKILYHWRTLEGSTALSAEEKIYTGSAGIKALQHYFAMQQYEEVVVEPGLAPNTYRVRYPVPPRNPLVSLLIPTRDKLEYLQPCIRSILEKTAYQNFEIIILDNGSVETETLDYFKSIQAADSRVRVLPYSKPFNFSAINNYGAQQARGEVLGLVNNDVEVINPEWLTEMVSHAVRPEIGCVGAKLYYDDDTIQHAGVILGLGGVAGHSHKYFPREASGYFHRLKMVQNLSAVTAACLLVRKSVYEEVGGLEEENLKIAFNDVDFCMKVREAGYRNLWTPYAELYHHESKSRGLEDTPIKVARFKLEIEYIQNKWGSLLQNDPYYNKNLSLEREDFSLR